MRIVLLIACTAFLSLKHSAQNTFPQLLPFTTIDYLDKLHAKASYDCSKNEKKAFLFYDIKSEPLAEVMFNGTNFVFTEKRITIFPIYFAGQMTKKADEDFSAKIPTQLFRTPETSMFKDFNIK
ncbi:MAG: hypothetical protein HY062_00220, partial [Bacteroidetes bacterium]|nr:hypothetical protein [Bacteroidota bacterium]